MTARKKPGTGEWMKYIRWRGFETERKLARKLLELGIFARRMPVSGMYESRRKLSLPDVLGITRDNLILAFQLKSTEKGRYAFRAYELISTIDFVTSALKFGLRAKGYAIVRFVNGNRSYWAGTVINPQDVRVLEVGGKKRYEFVSREVAEKYKFNTVQHGYPLETLLRKLGIVR